MKAATQMRNAAVNELMDEDTDGRMDARIDIRIDTRIRELGDWRGETLATVRALILEADPEVVEEWK